MLMNLTLVNYLSLSHQEAWLVTMLGTGLLNYFLLKASWRSGNNICPSWMGGGKTTVDSSDQQALLTSADIADKTVV